MSDFAVYTIKLIRELGEEDHRDEAEGHRGEGGAAAKQVAKELQEAIDATGLPVGRFFVAQRDLADGLVVANMAEQSRSYADDPDYEPPVVVNRYVVNDRIFAILAEQGATLLDDDLNELSHVVAEFIEQKGARA